MHVGAVAIFRGKAPPYRDFAALVEARLELVPRYRQRLQTVPFGRPVWVDDANFDLGYHVRHTALPRPEPGEDEEAPLRRLAGRLFSQRLDRDKPLWELWFIEGLGDDRFAILSKTHHCMIDGVSGVDIATVLLDGDPSNTTPPRAAGWAPRPAPSRAELVVSAVVEGVRSPVQLAREATREGSDARRFVLELAYGVGPLLGLAQMGMAPPSSLNRTLGPHRRFEITSIDLGRVKAIRAALGGTLNDVVLALVSGALRSLLLQRGEEPREDLRAMVPVSVRTAEQRGTLGNQVTAFFCPLPVAVADPEERLHRVSATMKGLKESKQAVGALTLTRLGDFAPPTLLAQAARLQPYTRFFNLVVTNVPGPQFPLYLLGCEMTSCHPVVPLAEQQTLGVALLSYNGRIGVGILADAGARDVAIFTAALSEEVDEMERVSAPREVVGRA